MSEYTSALKGSQQAMEWSLTESPKEFIRYAETTSTPSFYHVMNGQRLSFDAFVKWIEEWRSKTSEYKLVMDEFLRDGDRLAAYMTGTIKVDGADTTFESFMFAQVEKESGEMEWLIERSIWGPVGRAPGRGEN